MIDTLVLVRHGPSAHVHPVGAVDRSGVEQWRTDYDAAGIRAQAYPPAELARVASEAECLITSDLPRARESAARLFGDRRVVTSSLLREFPFKVPSWPTRLPLAAWGALMYALWQVGRWQGLAVGSTEQARVADAVRFVIEHVGAGATGVVITHAVFRVLMAEQLVRDGWAMRAKRGGYGHWSAWTFQREARATSATVAGSGTGTGCISRVPAQA